MNSTDPKLPTIRYLGNKRRLTAEIASRLKGLLPDGGTLVDLMAGSAAVGIHALSKYRIIANDVEPYSYAIAKALIEDGHVRLTEASISAQLLQPYSTNFEALEKPLSHFLKMERRLISSPPPHELYRQFCQDTPYINTWKNNGLAPVAKRLFNRTIHARLSFPYALFTTYFMNSYFGIKQCMQIDSIRYAIDEVAGPFTSPRDGVLFFKLITSLLYAMSSSVSSPGHFAQASRPNSETMASRLAKERRKDIWQLFLDNVDILYSELRSSQQSNLAFNLEATDFVPMLDGLLPSIEAAAIYIDPPYTDDHYSRYYHVLNTALLYDYPAADGVGRYRADRFASPFSIKSLAPAALEDLMNSMQRLGTSVLLSYNSTGLIPLHRVESICRSNFENVAITRIPHNHSSQGRPQNLKSRTRFEVLIACRPAS